MLKSNSLKTTESLPIWISLADLFFLDTEPDDLDYLRTAEFLVANNWSVQQTFEFTYKYIAPSFASNLGHLIYPVIGVWSGFHKDDVLERVQQSIKVREGKPDWYFLISDLWCKRMLRTLKFHRLESQMNSLMEKTRKP